MSPHIIERRPAQNRIQDGKQQGEQQGEHQKHLHSGIPFEQAQPVHCSHCRQKRIRHRYRRQNTDRKIVPGQISRRKYIAHIIDVSAKARKIRKSRKDLFYSAHRIRPKKWRCRNIQNDRAKPRRRQPEIFFDGRSFSYMLNSQYCKTENDRDRTHNPGIYTQSRRRHQSQGSANCPLFHKKNTTEKIDRKYGKEQQIFYIIKCLR